MRAFSKAVCRVWTVGGVLAIASFLGSCDSLVSVEAPDVIGPDQYGSARGASVLAVGAVTTFNGSVGNAVWWTGLVADELLATTSMRSLNTPYSDGRDPGVYQTSGGGAYIPLHQARQRLLYAINHFRKFAPDSTVRIGHLFALTGFVSVFLGEHFCAGMPLSRSDADLRPVYGQPLTMQHIMDSAITAFDSAMVFGADSARIVNLARIGKGRALLNLGRFADAASAVAGVPTNYVHNAPFLGSSGSFNPFFRSGRWNQEVTIKSREGTNGIDWRGANDRRVPLTNHSPPLVAGDSLIGYTRYQTTNAPIRFADGLEARLIEAEAALQSGDIATWLARHNSLRAAAITPALTALSDPGTPAARVDLHFRERAFWLFLTAHRQGDLRRLVRQYGRGAESVFPTGAWRDGVMYGTATSMTIPADEMINLNFTGCLNRDP